MKVDEDTLRRIIGSELDAKLDVRFAAFEAKIDKKLDTRFDSFELGLAKFFGQTQRHFDKQFNRLERKFDKKFDQMQNTLEGVLKRMDDDDTERAAMNGELMRHDRWIGELARNTDTTLSTP